MNRTFKTWATRNGNKGKLEFHNYVNPINEFNYAQYMKWHQIINGEYRKWNNWQKGIPFDSLFESAFRHMQALWILYHGYQVHEIEKDWEYDWVVSSETPKDFYTNLENRWYKVHKKDFIEQLNAIRFNTEAMKLQLLTNSIIDGEHWDEQKMEGGENEGKVFAETHTEDTES